MKKLFALVCALVVACAEPRVPDADTVDLARGHLLAVAGFLQTAQADAASLSVQVGEFRAALDEKRWGDALAALDSGLAELERVSCAVQCYEVPQDVRKQLVVARGLVRLLED